MSDSSSVGNNHSLYKGIRLGGGGGKALVATVPLEKVISDDFDFHGFAKAIRTDKTLSREEKIAYRAHFSPSAKTTIDLNHPVSSLSTHLDSAMRGAWNPNRPDEPLPDSHPLSKMWKEVWEETTVHHAGEAALYGQRMAEKGITFDDMNGYPAKVPPISLTHQIPGINAAAGPSEHGGVHAVVTKAFMDKVPADEQRAVLFHEAQHAFEPVLHGKEPFTAFILNRAKSAVSGNAAARNWERRADEHAAKTGHAAELTNFFERMGKFGTENSASQHKLLEHLTENGFSFDTKKTAQILNQVKETLYRNGIDKTEFGYLLPDINKQVDEKKLGERIGKLNESISAAASLQPQEEKPLSFRERISKTIANKTRSHPEDKDRIKALANTEKCDGCDPSHPSKLHGDRVKEISKTGIQGWSR